MAGQSQKDRERQRRLSPHRGNTQIRILSRSREISVGRQRRVQEMKDRMPFTMCTIPDPLLHRRLENEEGDPSWREIVQDDEPNDSKAVTNFIWHEYSGGRAGLYECDISRSGSPARSGGREPTDEPREMLTAIVPGGLPFYVKVTDVCIFLEEPEQRIYTIIGIQTDRLEYISNVQLEEFAHRAASIT